MKYKDFFLLLIWLISILFACICHGKEMISPKVRTVLVSKDEIVNVRTALGIATLIQLPENPTSAVMGDLESFKLEYLDGGLTIKPLKNGAKTNLYIYTDSQRFNVKLTPSGLEAADYIVYLKSKNQGVQPLQAPAGAWRKIGKTVAGRNFSLTALRLGQMGSESKLIDFSISCKRDMRIDPQWFWITQDGKNKPINDLFLKSLDAKSSVPVSGVITLKTQDLSDHGIIALEFRGPEKIKVYLAEVKKWMK